MKFEIKNRFTGDVQFTAEIDADSNLNSVKVGLAVRWAIDNDADLSNADLSKADLSKADLSEADLSGAYLRNACLRGADLRDAYLSGADLRGAYLSGADLRGADLRDADLSGADLRDADLERTKNIVFAQCGDYTMFLIRGKDGVMVKAGCRYFTLEKAKKHWSENKEAWTHKTDEYGKRQLRILAFLESELEMMGDQ